MCTVIHVQYRVGETYDDSAFCSFLPVAEDAQTQNDDHNDQQ